MQRIWILFILLPAITIGCKQQVDFGAAESTQLNDDNNGSSAGGPIVNIMQAPSNHKLNKSTQAVFEVIAGDNPIETVKCYVDSIVFPCDWVSGIVELYEMPLGIHWFEVVATDVEGLVGHAKEDWSIYNNFKKYEDALRVDASSAMTDILFVIDNSSSMRYEQTQISKRFNNFIDQVDDINWQIGITTTDNRQSPQYHWADGRLDPFANGDFFLTSDLGKQKAQELFSKHVRRKESGSDTERGILSTYRSIERAVAGRSQVDREIAKFFRPEAALAVVVVSDEDESGVGGKSDGDNLLELVKNEFGSKKIFQFNSIIVHTTECLYDTGHTMGRKYEALSRKTNGLVGNVCAKNYSQILTDLGKGVAELKRVHKLKCPPQDIDDDNKIDLLITGKKGGKVPGYTIDQETITFDKALKVGDYEFEYYCLEE